MDFQSAGKRLEERGLLLIRDSKILAQRTYKVREGDVFVLLRNGEEGLNLYLAPDRFDHDHWYCFGVEEISSEEDLAEGISLILEAANHLVKVAAFNELLAEREEEE